MTNVLITLTLGLSALESVSYLGFIKTHFFVSANIIYFVGLMLIYFMPFLLSSWLKKILTISSISVLLLYLLLTVLEFTHYPNYIYTLTHINLVGLQILVLLTWFHYIFSVVNLDKLARLGAGILIASLIFTASEGVGKSLAFITQKLAIAIKAPQATYAEKLIKSYGGFYPAMELVKQLTPDNALILIPPQGNPWEVEGNAPMVTYYLYPRKVENLGDTIPISSRPIYALIAHGSWPKTGDTDYGWPKISLPSTRLWQFDIINLNYSLYNRQYDPIADNWDWGLIEVKHD